VNHSGVAQASATMTHIRRPDEALCDAPLPEHCLQMGEQETADEPVALSQLVRRESQVSDRTG
jgi:hypothetical protein